MSLSGRFLRFSQILARIYGIVTFKCVVVYRILRSSNIQIFLEKKLYLNSEGQRTVTRSWPCTSRFSSGFSQISKLIVCSSFFLVFLGEVSVLVFYLKSFVTFLSYICSQSLFFFAIFNFCINVFFTIIVCLKLIGCTKWTKSLVVSNYPLANV